MAENNNNNKDNFSYSIDMGAIINAGAQYYAAEQAAKAAKQATEAQIKWERERALNAHQWEVVDLQKAGLNPILSANGQGATTGGISAPVPDTSGYGRAGEAILTAITKKKELENQTAATQAQVQNAIADTDLKKNQSNLAMAQMTTEMAKAGLINKQQGTEIANQTLKYAEAQKIDTETKVMLAKLDFEIGVLKEQIKLAQAEGKLKEKETLIKELERKYYTFNTIMMNLERGSKTLQNSAQAVNNVLEIIPAKKAIGFLTGNK